LTSAVEVLSLKVTMTLPQPFLVARQVTDGLVLLLGFLGAAVILRGGFRPQPDIIKD